MLDYYSVTREASLKIDNHAGLLYLQRLCKSANKVLDVGCGEGSRLHTLMPKGKNGWGIDISAEAIIMAKSQYPKDKFEIADAEKLPFNDASFDLVYSAFAIEHCNNPKKFIEEMLRVCSPGGQVVIICPNYGAPNRRSPVSIQNSVTKLGKGLIEDLLNSNSFSWKKVRSKSTYDHIDDDTTVEPYARSLYKYLTSQGVKVTTWSTLWEQEIKTKNPRKILTKILGENGIYPFNFWGPQIFISAQVAYRNKQ